MTTADIDPGFVVYDNSGAIHLVQWTSYLFGLQYYLPGTDGNVWISANYSNIASNNLKNFTTTAATQTEGPIPSWRRRSSRSSRSGAGIGSRPPL